MNIIGATRKCCSQTSKSFLDTWVRTHAHTWTLHRNAHEHTAVTHAYPHICRSVVNKLWPWYLFIICNKGTQIRFKIPSDIHSLKNFMVIGETSWIQWTATAKQKFKAKASLVLEWWKFFKPEMSWNTEQRHSTYYGTQFGIVKLEETNNFPLVQWKVRVNYC